MKKKELDTETAQQALPIKKRLLSLDALRGITVAGMILVNNAGGKVSYAPLQHSAWNGLTPCDLVFPFFLFIMGISTYISLNKFNFNVSLQVVTKILKRTFYASDGQSVGLTMYVKVTSCLLSICAFPGYCNALLYVTVLFLLQPYL